MSTKDKAALISLIAFAVGMLSGAILQITPIGIIKSILFGLAAAISIIIIIDAFIEEPKE